jgi:hypothetical protein
MHKRRYICFWHEHPTTKINCAPLFERYEQHRLRGWLTGTRLHEFLYIAATYAMTYFLLHVASPALYYGKCHVVMITDAVFTFVMQHCPSFLLV